MSACHAGDPGSIPGECILLLFFLTPKCSSVANITFHPSSVAIHVHKHFSLYFIFSNNFNWQVFKSRGAGKFRLLSRFIMQVLQPLSLLELPGVSHGKTTVCRDLLKLKQEMQDLSEISVGLLPEHTQILEVVSTLNLNFWSDKFGLIDEGDKELAFRVENINALQGFFQGKNVGKGRAVLCFQGGYLHEGRLRLRWNQ
jgi:hypothetical protein